MGRMYFKVALTVRVTELIGRYIYYTGRVKNVPQYNMGAYLSKGHFLTQPVYRELRLV